MVNQLKDEENKDRFTINWSRDWKKVIWRASHCDAIVGWICGSPRITGSWIQRAPIKGIWWHLNVGSLVFSAIRKTHVDYLTLLSTGNVREDHQMASLFPWLISEWEEEVHESILDNLLMNDSWIPITSELAYFLRYYCQLNEGKSGESRHSFFY